MRKWEPFADLSGRAWVLVNCQIASMEAVRIAAARCTAFALQGSDKLGCCGLGIYALCVLCGL